MNPIDVLRSVDFDWAMRLSGVWEDSPWDVADLHKDVRAEFIAKIDSMKGRPSSQSPLGYPIVGPGGAGKTHLLGVFRREAVRRNVAFVLVDMTDVRDFWETVLQGYLDSLQQRYDGPSHQHQHLLSNVIQRLGPNKPVADILFLLASRKSSNLPGDIAKVLKALHLVHPRETVKYHNVVRALICLNSEDFTTSSMGMSWLQGQEVDPAEKQAFGLTTAREEPRKIIEALSWVMSLSGPTVVAFDQLDPIVAELALTPDGLADTEQRSTARKIFSQIATGLGTLRDLTRNTLTLVSCLETTWQQLLKSAMATYLDRFEPPRMVRPDKDNSFAEALVRGRLQIAFAKHGFRPEYPTWPFKPRALESLVLSTPRQILQKCDGHIRECIRASLVREIDLFPLPVAKTGNGPTRDERGGLDERFKTLRSKADPRVLLDEKKEDEQFAPLLQTALSCLLRENEPPSNVDAQVDADFAGGATTRPLHARLRLIFLDEKSREEHYSVRSLQHGNARAYQTRLKAAMTQSGIEKSLKFRRLTIVRSVALPGGGETEKLTRKFEEAGGLFVRPAEDEIRSLFALHQLKQEAGPEFEPWLKHRKPASGLKLIQEIVRDSQIIGGGIAVVIPKKPEGGSAPKATVEKTPVNVAGPRLDPLPLGRRFHAGKLGEPLTMPIVNLEKHTAVFAGAGSGKTVLLKRLIEEAALRGIPSIVIDGANDLAALDEVWEKRPETWAEGDDSKAKAFHERAEVVVWTPGRESGNPIALEPLPDLGAVADVPEELESAVAMVRDSLKPVVAAGKGVKDNHKLGILSNALRVFAKQGAGHLEDLIALLEDFPRESHLLVPKEDAMAKEIAGALRVARELSPMLRSAGTPLDPAILFGDDRPSKRTRISVISLVGLAGLESQQHFLNQLAMTLFSWIRKHPAPPGRPLRGLLVIDEARDFVPSVKASTCKESLTRLVAQARKYHLGLVFATQNPKDVDNRIISNCSTHYYGKVNSPAAIDAAQDLIRQKGGSGDDVARLGSGQFYVHNADVGLAAPARVSLPMCLSRHPASPLEEAQILQKAVASRDRLRGPRDAS
jgi:Ni2+-binding GTPase involved in maturation of urease and hydrogenase